MWSFEDAEGWVQGSKVCDYVVGCGNYLEVGGEGGQGRDVCDYVVGGVMSGGRGGQR